MSKMGNHRVSLQERPQYEDGWEAWLRAERRDFHPWPVGSVESYAHVLGWDDAETHFSMRNEA